VTFKRTPTGILSNRRPVGGTTANSGATTPDPETPRLSLLGNAKREAAKRGLYSRFFRGPVLAPHEGEHESSRNGSNHPKSETYAVGNSEVEGAHSLKRKSASDREERKGRKRWKGSEKAHRKQTKDKDRVGRNKTVQQSENPEESRAKDGRKRGEREARRQAKQKAQGG
jgi:hypothetical protein